MPVNYSFRLAHTVLNEATRSSPSVAIPSFFATADLPTLNSSRLVILLALVLATTYTGYEYFGLVDRDQLEIKGSNTAGRVWDATMASL